MPMLNRDKNQLRFLSLYLGKDSRLIYQDIYKEVKAYGLKRFIKRSLILFEGCRSMYDDETNEGYEMLTLINKTDKN